MTKADQKLHTDEFVLVRRDKNGKWDSLSRDHDEDVMKIRFAYVASMLVAGEAVQLIRPDCTVLLQKEFDIAPAAE